MDKENMEHHFIIGKGNLGLSIGARAAALGHRSSVTSKSMGFSWPRDLKLILDQNPTHIWITAGFGSVEACEKDRHSAFYTHVELPDMLMYRIPEHIKICAFSTDYVAHENYPSDPSKTTNKIRSYYAITKRTLEENLRILSRPNSSVVRISTLYGLSHWDKCLPARLKHRYPRPCSLELPINQCTPTHTDWLAFMLLHADKDLFKEHPTIHHCAPKGNVTIKEFGQYILGKDYKIEGKGYDPQRPEYSNLGCSFSTPNTVSWLELWAASQWSLSKDRKAEVLRRDQKTSQY